MPTAFTSFMPNHVISLPLQILLQLNAISVCTFSAQVCLLLFKNTEANTGIITWFDC